MDKDNEIWYRARHDMITENLLKTPKLKSKSLYENNFNKSIKLFDHILDNISLEDYCFENKYILKDSFTVPLGMMSIAFFNPIDVPNLTHPLFSNSTTKIIIDNDKLNELYDRAMEMGMYG